jgi:predicted  nucleic acid-binding Zn-ribbon protein
MSSLRIKRLTPSPTPPGSTRTRFKSLTQALEDTNRQLDRVESNTADARDWQQRIERTLHEQRGRLEELHTAHAEQRRSNSVAAEALRRELNDLRELVTGLEAALKRQMAPS